MTPHPSPWWLVQQGPAATYHPEKALWCAVLESWWADRQTTTRTDTGARRQVSDVDLAWLHSDAIYPTSFAWICEMVGFDPDWTRRQMLETPHHGRQGRRSDLARE